MEILHFLIKLFGIFSLKWILLSGYMIKKCPYSTDGLSFFIADSHNPCIFYWCVNGNVISEDTEMKCPNGLGVPYGYAGYLPPCSKINYKDCLVRKESKTTTTSTMKTTTTKTTTPTTTVPTTETSTTPSTTTTSTTSSTPAATTKQDPNTTSSTSSPSTTTQYPTTTATTQELTSTSTPEQNTTTTSTTITTSTETTTSTPTMAPTTKPPMEAFKAYPNQHAFDGILKKNLVTIADCLFACMHTCFAVDFNENTNQCFFHTAITSCKSSLTTLTNTTHIRRYKCAW